ncbi:MAG: tripartite tricarboxylate transporter permease [Negativicutes bacterium]
MENLIMGFETALSWQNLLYCLIGVSIGMLVGVLPGLAPSTGTAVLLPITYGMEATPAIIMLSGIYYGAMYGGTITSILINTPGEAASAITCLDGHPLALKGRAGAALGVAAIGSFWGGTVSIIGLAFIGPPIAMLALNFGPPEYFALMMLGMTLVVGLMGKSALRGLLAALIGLNLALIGMDPVSGVIRFAGGIDKLTNGFDFVPLVMGLFGISEILLSSESEMRMEKPPMIKGFLPNRDEWKPTIAAILRGTGIGFLIGLIPGTNSVIPTIISYSVEKKMAKDPSRFGHGAIEGVAGPETANNAFCGAALIPLFTLGIPTSPVIAILLGAFIMHGLAPGPQLFVQNSQFVWGVIASMFVGNAILLFMNLPMAGMWAKIMLVPFKLLFPMVLAVAVVGAYSINNSLFDVGVMIIFGIVGYLFKKVDIPLAPVVLTFVLGEIMETSLLQALTIFKGSFVAIVTRPIAGTLLVLAVIVVILSVVSSVRNKRGALESDVEM